MGGGYNDVRVDDVVVQILDDESASVVIGTTRATVAEDGTLEYTISLTQIPDADEDCNRKAHLQLGGLHGLVRWRRYGCRVE